MSHSPRLMFVTTGLNTGGAETALLGLLERIATIQSVVVSVLPCEDSQIAHRIRSLGIPVHSLGLKLSAPNPFTFITLLRLVYRYRPQIIQGWMYHGNLLSSIAGFISRTPVSWGIRQCLYDVSREHRPTQAIIKICSKLSWSPEFVIYNSDLAAQQHIKLGFREDKKAIIPNGFDCDKFHPDPLARQRLLKECGLPKDAIMIGLIARFHPMKDHANFIAAATMVAAKEPRARFVFAGEGITESNFDLMRLIASSGIKGRFSLLGNRSDTSSITAALDIACSSSWSEGFSNSIGEAMACGVPCVVTDVGESSTLVSTTGIIVSPCDPDALAAGIMEMIENGPIQRNFLGNLARRRIQENFPLSLAASRYASVYGFICANKVNLVTVQNS